MLDWKHIKKRDTHERDGDTLHLCENHVHTEGLWDGLYMFNKPENHDQRKIK